MPGNVGGTAFDQSAINTFLCGCVILASNRLRVVLPPVIVHRISNGSGFDAVKVMTDAEVNTHVIPNDRVQTFALIKVTNAERVDAVNDSLLSHAVNVAEPEVASIAGLTSHRVI